jgi:hypothetical protein
MVLKHESAVVVKKIAMPVSALQNVSILFVYVVVCVSFFNPRTMAISDQR